MKTLRLKYGCNPNQIPAALSVETGELPVQVLNGRPGYINFLDALNGWQLVRELAAACGLPAAASFKHTSPAGAALGLALSETERAVCAVPEGLGLSELACAYARARGADRMSSYGDWAALSEVCDEPTALLLRGEVSDGVIASGYTPAALDILKQKRSGGYNVVAIDPGYSPPAVETRQLFGITFTQGKNDAIIDEKLLENIVTQKKDLSAENKRDLVVALITLKYTQSNSVCYAQNGMAVGVGAGQQSRLHCTRLAGDKADLWRLRSHPQVLALPFVPGLPRPARDNAIEQYLGEDAKGLLADGVWQGLFTRRPKPLTQQQRQSWLDGAEGLALASDAFFPFADNIERAARSGVGCIAQPGGSMRDEAVVAACDAHGITMAFTGLRLFYH